MDIKSLREEYGNLHAENSKLIQTAAEEKRALTAEEAELKDKRFARMDSIKATADDMERLAREAFSTKSEAVQTPEAPAGREAFLAERAVEASGKAECKFTVAEQRQKINNYLQTGDHRELYTITTTTGSSTFLPNEVLAAVAVRTPQDVFRQALNFYNMPVISSSSTETYTIPLVDDSANIGATLSQSASSSTDLDSNPAPVVLDGTKLWQSKAQWYSRTMVLAQGFDVLGFTLPRLQVRIDRARHSAAITILKTKTVGKTTASDTAMTYAELLAFEHSLPVAYRNNMAMFVSDSYYQLLRGLVDSNNRPIMDTMPQNVFQQAVHGIPVFVSEYLDVAGSGYTAGGKVAALVNCNSIFLRDVTPARIAKYVDIPTYPDQIGFNLFENGDIGFDGNGVRLLAIP